MDNKTERALGMKGGKGYSGKLQGQKPMGSTGKPNVTPVGGMRPMATSGGKKISSSEGLRTSKGKRRSRR